MASVFKRGGKGNRHGWYYISYFDHNGKRQSRSARTTDKATAERIAAKLEADAALRRDGVIDTQLDAICDEAQRTVESHLADYESKLRAASRTDDHVSRTLQFIRVIARQGGSVSATDISADKVNRFAGQLRDEGRSARTVQAYLTAIKGFTKWLSANQKLARDPLASVQKPNPKTDRRRERRPLLPDEWRWLRATTAASGERYGIPAAERVLLYATAIQTGLRSGELRSLTRGRLFLDSKPPFITCKAGSTKNSKDARQYIQTDVAADLRRLVATKAPHAPVFCMPADWRVAAMLRADLAGARREWLHTARNDSAEHARREQSDFLTAMNHDGERLDFHSLRHTCGAWLAMSGAHPKAVQAVMRHSSITLTMDTYGHLFPGQESETVARFPEMMSDGPEVLKATGTDDTAAITAEQAQRQAQQLGRDSVRAQCDAVREENGDDESDESPNALRLAKLGEAVRDSAIPRRNGPGRIRTCNQGIMSPLLCH